MSAKLTSIEFNLQMPLLILARPFDADRTFSLVFPAVVQIVSYQRGLTADDHEEIAQVVVIHLWQDDCRLLMRFDPHRGTVMAYLAAIIRLEVRHSRRATARRRLREWQPHASEAVQGLPEHSLSILLAEVSLQLTSTDRRTIAHSFGSRGVDCTSGDAAMMRKAISRLHVKVKKLLQQ